MSNFRYVAASRLAILSCRVQRFHFLYSYAAPVYEVLYESAKISSLRIIRDDENHEECVAVHRIFGDIFMAYEAYKSKSIPFICVVVLS